MRIIKSKRIVAIILSFCFIALLVYVPLAEAYSTHDCSGEHCDVCYQINQFHNTLRQFNAVVTIALAIGVSYILITAMRQKVLFSLKTLVWLKVQSNS